MVDFVLKGHTCHPRYTNEQHLSRPLGPIEHVLGKQKVEDEACTNKDMPLSDISRAQNLNMATLH